jgi:hypothetical protein
MSMYASAAASCRMRADERTEIPPDVYGLESDLK